MSVSSTNTFCKLNAFLQVEVNALLLYLRSEAKPCGHAVELNVTALSLALIEFERSRQLVHEAHLVIFLKMALLLKGIVKVHQIDGLQA